MFRFGFLADFLGAELLLVAKCMADGSYWKEDSSLQSEFAAPAEPAYWE